MMEIGDGEVYQTLMYTQPDEKTPLPYSLAFSST